MEIDQIKQLLNEASKCNNNMRFNPLEEGNIFSILNVEKKEVTTHSAFLDFIFKPFLDKKGDVDDLNLRVLLKKLLNRIHKNVDINQYSFVDLQREVVVEEGRLDFLIIADMDQFVIELKIDAGEQPNQMERYTKYLEEHEQDPSHIFFLTPIKRESITGKSTNITLVDDICGVLYQITKLRNNNSNYCFMIKQYVELIKNMTNEKEIIMDNTIFENRDQLVAVDVLYDTRKKVLTKILQKFFNILKQKEEINIKGFPLATLVKDYPYGNDAIGQYYMKSSWWPAIVYKIGGYKFKHNMKLNEGFELYFYIEIGHDLYCGFTPRINTEYDLKPIKVNVAIDNYRTIKRNSNFFPRYESIRLNSHILDFTISGLNTRDSFLNELLETREIYKDNEINISFSKMNEIMLSIDRLYMEMCEDLFEL